MLSFGQKVKAIRTEAGFSQAYLAELIGVSAQSVSNWECDNTMPDISQIVPLAGALSVSTDFLLGMGFDEAGDKKNLEERIDTIWATYSVNTNDNNADLLAATCYEDYLRKYPMAYDVKYKCALALNDYVKVVEERRKFKVSKQEIDSIYLKCDKYLEAIIDNADEIELKINACTLRISHLLLRGKFQDALQIVEKLPSTSGIKEESLSDILYKSGKETEAKKVEFKAAKAKCLDYLSMLFKMALNEKDKKLELLNTMEAVATQSVDLYLDVTELKVNDYESMPYCYLLTAQTAKCNYYIKEGNMELAYESLDKAIDTACEMYSWVYKQTSNQQVLEDYKFFKENVPYWAFRFSKQYESDDNDFTRDERYKRAIEKLC